MAVSATASAVSTQAMRFLLGAVFLGAVDLSVISTLLLPIVRDLEQNTADIDRYAWVVIGYLLAYVAAIPIFGRLIDVAGVRVTLALGLAVFLAGTLMTVTAGSLEGLIVGRVVQGTGGGAILPIAMAFVTVSLPASARLGGYGLVAAVDTLGWVLGPILGALVVSLDGLVTHSWRLAFAPNILLVAGLVFVVRRGDATMIDMPRSHGRSGGGWLGVVLLTAGVSLANLALASAGQLGSGGGATGLRALGGTENPLTDNIPLFVVGALVFLVAFWVVERTTSRPAFPIEMRASRTFVTGTVVGLAIGVASAVVIATVPVYAALRSTTQSPSSLTAILLTPHTLATAIAAALSGRLERRIGLRRTIVVGMATGTIGSLGVALALDRTTSTIALVPGLVLLGAGLGLSLGPILALGLQGIPERLAGSGVSALLGARLLGATMGISAITAFGTWRIQALLSDLQPVPRIDGESTADYFVRQADYLDTTVVPRAVQAISEIYVLGAATCLIAAITLIRAIRPSPP